MFGNAPHHMNRAVIPVALQDQHGWLFSRIRIVLDQNGRPNARQSVGGDNTIRSKFSKAVAGNEVVARQNERLHAAQRFAHAARPQPGSLRDPTSPFQGEVWPFRYSAASTRFFFRPPRASTGAKNCPV